MRDESALYLDQCIELLFYYYHFCHNRLDRRLISAKLRRCGELDVKTGLKSVFDVDVDEVFHLFINLFLVDRALISEVCFIPIFNGAQTLYH